MSNLTPAEIALAAQNIGPLERNILRAIATYQARTTPELIELLPNRQEVISNTLNKLVKKGLLYKQKDKAQRRGFVYGTTPFPE